VSVLDANTLHKLRTGYIATAIKLPIAGKDLNLVREQIEKTDPGDPANESRTEHPHLMLAMQGYRRNNTPYTLLVIV
jgi:hypothetical protein